MLTYKTWCVYKHGNEVATQFYYLFIFGNRRRFLSRLLILMFVRTPCIKDLRCPPPPAQHLTSQRLKVHPFNIEFYYSNLYPSTTGGSTKDETSETTVRNLFSLVFARRVPCSCKIVSFFASLFNIH